MNSGQLIEDGEEELSLALDVDASDVVAFVVLRPDQADPADDDHSSDPRFVPGLGEQGLAALTSVLDQDAVPGIVVVVHTGARAPVKWKPENLGTLFLQVHTPEARNLGQAVTAAFASEQVTAVPGVNRANWLWIVHDDMLAEPGALAELLAVARPSGSLSIVGPKQVGYSDADQLLEVGIEATASGRRVNSIEPDEIDQGQRDDVDDVLAVGTAGALIRMTTWQELGGFDPVLGPFGDGLEYGRRHRRAGHRVAVAPRAVIRHRQQAYGHGNAGRNSFESRRAAQLYNWCVAAPGWSLPLLALWLPVLTVLRCFGRLLMRQPGLARDEVAAYFRLLGSSGSLLRRRRATASVASVPRSALRPLEANPRSIARARRAARRITAKGKDDKVQLDQGALGALNRHRIFSASILLVLLLLLSVVAAVIWHPFALGISGGAWGDLPAYWTELVQQGWSGWQISGDGFGGPASPVLLPLSLLTAPFALVGVSPDAVAQWVMFAALPLAALFGWIMTGCFSRSVSVRSAGALLWAAGPVLLTSMTIGNLSTTLAYLATPLLIAGVSRGMGPALRLRLHGVTDVESVSRPDRFSWLGLAGFAMLFVAAASPIIMGLALAALVMLALCPVRLCALPRRLWLRAAAVAVIIVPSVVMIAPMIVAQTRTQSSAAVWQWFLGDLGVGAVQAPSWWQSLAGFPVGIEAFGASVSASWTSAWQIASVAAGTAILVWALVSLAFRLTGSRAKGSSAAVRFAPAVLFALGIVTLATGVLGASSNAAPIPSAVASASFLAVAAWCSGSVKIIAARQVIGRYGSAGGLGRGVAASVGVIASTATIGAVLVLGPLGPLTQTEGNASALSAVAPPSASFPLIATEAQQSDRRARVLLLGEGRDGILSASLLRGAGVQLADISGSTLESASENGLASGVAQQSLAELAAVLASGMGDDSARAAAEHAIDIILVPGTLNEFSSIQNALDATSGLERIGTVDAGTMWRVRPEEERPARVTLRYNEGTVETIKSGVVNVRQRLTISDDAMLVLAETADPAWHASFDGRALEPTTIATDSWAQAFLLPQGEGILKVTYEPSYRLWWWIAAGLSLLTLIACAIPWRYRPALKQPLSLSRHDTGHQPSSVAVSSQGEEGGDDG